MLTYRIRTDMGLIEVVRAMLTEVAVEMGLSEQQLRRSTGFIIGILSYIKVPGHYAQVP